MFSLIPWRRGRRTGELIPRTERFGLLNDFETVFDRLFGGWPLVAAPDEMPLAWSTDFEETEKEVIVRAELPGFELSEIDVRVAGDLLTIKAEHHEAKAKEGEKEAKTETRVDRTLRRSVTLPPGTDTEKAVARYHNGVLELRLPRLPEASGRSIEVKAA